MMLDILVINKIETPSKDKTTGNTQIPAFDKFKMVAMGFPASKESAEEQSLKYLPGGKVRPGELR